MNIIVIGDIMIDINYYSSTNRNASEANIPIYNIIDTKMILGGAGNVVNNLKNLNCNVEIISVIGNDIMGKNIINLLEDKKILNKIFIDDNRKTSQKNRFINNNNIVFRFDIEDTHDINNELQNEIYNYIITKKDINAIVISDYDKGLITYSLSQNIINYSNKNNIYTFIDPKIKNYLKYYNCFFFKPNFNEASIIANNNDIDYIFDFIKSNINCNNLLITDGANGMFINKKHINHKNKINVIDVTGAGDIVLCVIVYIYLLTKDIIKSVHIANIIGGKSVQQIGNYNINYNDINKLLFTTNIIYENDTNKIINLSKNKNIVFTNGCFDIIHSAHIKLLQFAKKQGDILIVGLNSDESIKRLKGNERPINDENERLELLNNLNIIDYIIIFNSDTPLDIIKLLKPKILVKGSDYTKENIIGKEYVSEIILFDYIKNKSSTLIINKMKNI